MTMPAALPDLPQVPVLRSVVDRLQAHRDIQAIWLGGSFATGLADPYSDVDLRIAVNPDQLPQWRDLGCKAVFDPPPPGFMLLPFGDDAFLHHLLLDDGTIFDFYVQSTDSDNHEPAIHLMLCRDEAMRQRLISSQRPPDAASHRIDAGTAVGVLNEFWINSHKHRKVLGRKLQLLAALGVQLERSALLRLWEMLLTGADHGSRPSIHGLSSSTRQIEQQVGADVLGLFGLPLRTEDEIVTAIEAHRDEVGRVGRLLAAREAFAYPGRLEQVVRESWRAFRHHPGGR